jgi:hypothetical protein
MASLNDFIESKSLSDSLFIERRRQGGTNYGGIMEFKMKVAIGSLLWVRNYGFNFDLFDSRALEILSRDALASNSNQVDCQMFPFLCNVSFANCIFGLYRFREADSFSPIPKKAS